MGGNHEIPKVPDWKIYKVEDVPQLMSVKKALACHNLKYPWLRNYVWVYHEYHNNKEYVNLQKGLLKGWKPGFVAALICTVFYNTYLDFIKPDDH